MRHRESMEIGESMPAVSAKDHDGQDFEFASWGGSGLRLVFFYPKAETPGCIAQACSLRDAFEELSDAGVEIVGVSADKVETQRKFRENRRLPFRLVSDREKRVMKAFGVPATLGFAKRQAYLFKEGKLAWKDEKAATKKQAEEALEAVRSLD